MAITEWLSAKQLAEYIGVSVKTVYDWNYKEIGPPRYKVRGVLKYKRHEVDAWLERYRIP